jgi:hypothetical protein
MPCPEPEDDELAVEARAVEADDGLAVRAAIIAVVRPSGVGGMIETVTKDPIFEFEIVRVDAARWLDIGQPGSRAAVPPGAGKPGTVSCGLNLQALVVYLIAAHAIPVHRCAGLIEVMTGAAPSPGCSRHARPRRRRRWC